jgi:hypothetical protein
MPRPLGLCNRGISPAGSYKAPDLSPDPHLTLERHLFTYRRAASDSHGFLEDVK